MDEDAHDAATVVAELDEQSLGEIRHRCRMLRLLTLGGLAFERDQSRPSGVATTRHRLAMLAVLAVAGQRGISRDKLLGVLWPESDAEKARRALTQALYALRRDLGEDDVVLGISELRLNAALLESDYQQLRAALADGNSDRVLELYAGPFLDGFFLNEPGFERWVDDVRGDLAHDVTLALEHAARAAQREGELARSTMFWRRVVAIDRFAKSANIGLMTVLAEMGERAEAIQHFRTYETLLAKELECAPDPAVAALSSRIRAEIDRAAAALRAEDRLAGPAIPAPPVRPSMDTLPVSGEPEQRPVSTPKPERRQHRIAITALAAGVALSVVSAIALTSSSHRRELVTFTIPPPSGAHFTMDLRDVSAVSPDGRDIIIGGTDTTGTTSLWLRRLADRAATRIPGTEFGSQAFWAPDGKKIGFFARNALMVIDRAGGSPRVLARAVVDPYGGSWADDGTILYTPSSQSGIYLTSLADTTVRQLTRVSVERHEIGHMWPQALPGGKSFLYFVASDVDSIRGVYLGSIGSPRGRRVVGAPASAVYAEDHLLYVREGALVAQRIDLGRASLVGNPWVVADSVTTSFVYYGAFSASPNGVLVYASGRSRDVSRLTWVDARGTVQSYASGDGYIRNPVLSRDGRYMAYETYRDSYSSIRYADIGTGVSSVLSVGNTQPLVPVWSPEGATLAFIEERPGKWNIYRKDIHGAGPPELLFRLPHYTVITDWSGRDSSLILTERTQRGDYDLIERRLSAPEKPIILAGGPGHQAGGRLSPDEKFIAYIVVDSGKARIVVQHFPNSGSRCELGEGFQPVWGTGGDIYYLGRSGTAMLAKVDLRADAPCPTGPPRALFETHIGNPESARAFFDVSLRKGLLLFNLPALHDRVWLNVNLNWLAAEQSGR